MPTKWYESEVISIKTLSPQTKEFVLKVSEEEIFSFLPGQFVTMDLPLGEKDTKDGEVIVLPMLRIKKSS